MNHLITIMIILSALLMRCTTDTQLAGLSTELENPVYVGVVLDAHMSPAAKAHIAVYKIIGISTSDKMIDTFGVELTSKTTGNTGMFSLSDLSSGDYAIQSFSSDSSLTALKRVSINYTGSTIHDTLILGNPGTIRGVVTRGGQLPNSTNTAVKDGDIRIVIQEINRSAITGPDGVFKFTGVPEGVYTLAIYPGDNFFSEILKAVIVTADSVTSIDTVLLERIPWVKPPKPVNLTCAYDTVSASVKLTWNPVKITNLLGYIIERRFQETILEPNRIFSKDTTYTESLLTYQPGKQIYYSVRSLTIQYEESYPEGPVGILVVH